MAYAYTIYSAGSSQTDYTISWPYIKEEHVKVYVNFVDTSFTFHNATTARLASAPASGTRVEVRRVTPPSAVLVDYADGSTLTASDLDTSNLQHLYIAQELDDNLKKGVSISTSTGLPTLGSKRLTEVADPTAAQDAATKNYVDTTRQPVDAELTELATMSSGTASSLADLTNTEVQILDGATVTTDELNKLDGVTATTAEINYVDGVTSNVQTQLNAKQPLDAELTELATMASDTASSLADLTAAEVQALDGVTASTAELNILDGVTATTAELNYVDGVTSNVQTQLDAKQPLDGELTTLGGMPSGTASILASSTALTSTTAELNLLDGKSVVTSVSGSSTDVQLPTAKAVNDQIVNLLNDAGGFVPIANEVSFPNANPDPNDGAGTIVSIADAGGIVVNGSGVSTTGRTLGGSTVTINGIDSSLNSSTIAAGKGMLVQTTSTLNTYTYHRLVVDEAGVANAQSLVSDFGDRYQIASSAPTQHPDGSALAEGDLWFDTSANTMKVYDGSNYAAVTSVGDYKLLTVVPDGATSGAPVFNGSNVSFDLRDDSNAASITSVGQLLVSLNGVLQKPNSGSWSSSNEGFHLEGTNGIKFCTAPPSGSSIFVTLIGSATSVNVPATNSVVEAAIQSNVVSEEKLKVSNSPTNGYYLQAQSGNSGGLTWAAVAQYSTPLTTRGDILYRDASGDQRLAKGTAGQYLKIGANDPEWADVVAATADGVLWENNLTISNDYTIAATKGAHSVGPITNNATVTVNGRWVIS
tara:strand:- start:769 stop:3048 length:2280 start_codon:yes stop_codon:yes gene_type:complete